MLNRKTLWHNFQRNYVYPNVFTAYFLQICDMNSDLWLYFNIEKQLIWEIMLNGNLHISSMRQQKIMMWLSNCYRIEITTSGFCFLFDYQMELLLNSTWLILITCVLILSDPLPFNGYKNLCILCCIGQHTAESFWPKSTVKNLKFLPFVITADHFCSHLISHSKILVFCNSKIPGSPPYWYLDVHHLGSSIIPNSVCRSYAVSFYTKTKHPEHWVSGYKTPPNSKSQRFKYAIPSPSE